MLKNLKHTTVLILIVITLLLIVALSLATSKPISQNEIKGISIPLDPITNGKWSGLQLNFFPSENIYIGTAMADGFTELRHLVMYNDSLGMSDSKAKVLSWIAKGAKVIWGVSAPGAPTPITAANWPNYHAAILDAAQWAQNNGVYEFQIGNEEEYHIDGTTMTVAQIRLNMKSTATEVQRIFTRGNVCYTCAADMSAINEWNVLGRGDIDLIAWTLYVQTPSSSDWDWWKSKIDNIIAKFGATHTYLSEFNLNCFSLDSYSTDETVQAAKLSEMVDYVRASGMTRAYYYQWKGKQGFVKDDGTYRLNILSSLVNKTE